MHDRVHCLHCAKCVPVVRGRHVQLSASTLELRNTPLGTNLPSLRRGYLLFDLEAILLKAFSSTIVVDHDIRIPQKCWGPRAAVQFGLKAQCVIMPLIPRGRVEQKHACLLWDTLQYSDIVRAKP